MMYDEENFSWLARTYTTFRLYNFAAYSPPPADRIWKCLHTREGYADPGRRT